MVNTAISEIQDSFFLISSDDLENVETDLYGFIISDGKVIVDKNKVDLDKLDGTGAYCYISRKDDEISIHQDFCGCYGLYIYEDEKSDFFVISNSFLKIVEYLKDKVPISIDYDYAKSFIPVSLVPFAYSRTLINEIKTLNKDLIVNIEINEKSINYTEVSYGEKSVELESGEALTILDKWFNKWVGILNNLYSKTNNISLHLSGGFDTRLILALALSSQVDLKDIDVYASLGDNETKPADLKISTKIADYYNFTLNNGLNVKKNYFDTMEESINRSLYSKLGFCKLMYWSEFCYDSNIFVLTGYGGELLRKFYKHSSVEDLIRFNENLTKKYSEDMVNSARVILEDAFEQYSKMGDNLSVEELFNLHYMFVRNRNWFGKNTAESILYNEIKLNPLLDPLINKLNCNVDNDYILHALIFLRYCPELLNFEFEGGRKISPETMEFAKKINDIRPFKFDESNKEKLTVTRNQDSEISDEGEEKFSIGDIREHIKEVFDSNYFKNLFLMYFPEEAYDKMAGNYKDVMAAVSILKLIEYVHFNQLKFNDSNEDWFNLCLTESKNTSTRKDSEFTHSPTLTKYLTARLDIINEGSKNNDVLVKSISDERCDVLRPAWRLTEKGQGTQIESGSGNLDFELTCVNDGILKIILRSKNVQDVNKKRLPIYIDFKNFTVDSEVIFENHPVISHDEFYFYSKKVSDNQKVKIHIEWEPFNENSYFEKKSDN